MMELYYKVFRWSEHKWLIIGVLAGMAISIGLGVYIGIYGLDFRSALLYTSQLFAMDVRTPFELKELLVHLNAGDAIVNLDGDLIKPVAWRWIYLASFFATLTLVIGVFLLFFRHLLAIKYRNELIQNGDHSIIIGLGRNSEFFIRSELDAGKDHQLIVFEKDKANPLLKRYQKRKLAVVTENPRYIMEKLNIKKCKNIFISTGDDETNIYFALMILELLPQHSSVKKMILHVEDRTLRNLYSDEGILASDKVDIRLFSYYKESARLLFQKYALEGDDRSLINSTDDFSIAVVGNTDLSISVVSEACRLAHYPNQNKLNIYLIAKGVKQLESKILYAFPEIEALKALIEIEYIEADYDSIEFYREAFWKEPNLKHIICSLDDVSKNISIATKLKNVVYLRQATEAKIHIATMDHIQIAKEIKKFNQKGSNVYSFAQADEVCSSVNLLNNDNDRIAKWIHYLYDKKKTPPLLDETEEIDNKLWNNCSIHNRRASVGQAIHLKTKLKSLGLSYRKEDNELNVKELYEYNQRLLSHAIENYLQESGFTQELIHELYHAYLKRFSLKETPYFPNKKFELWFEKLLRMEHNRWMAVKILMDFEYKEEISEEQRGECKQHPLLKPFEDFEEEYAKVHIRHDILAILCIPFYLTKAGFIMEAFKNP